MASKKAIMHIVGTTALTNQWVYGGVFAMYDTHGLPLDILFGLMFEYKMMPCWTSFYDDAIKGGWKHTRVIKAIDYGLRDAGQIALAEIVIARLDRLEAA